MIMPGPQASHSRDPPHFRSGNTRTRHNPEPGMLPQIVEPQAVQARAVAQCSPGGVPLQHWLRRIVSPPLASRPEVMLGLRMTEEIGAFEHARHSLDRRGVQRDDAVARLVLASPNVQQSFHEIHVAPANVLHLHRTHRCVAGDDRGAVHVLPFGIRSGDVEQAPPLLARQRPADGPLTLRQVLDVISQRSPPATELQHTRQHANVHVDGPIRDAGVVTGKLEIRNRRRGYFGE